MKFSWKALITAPLPVPFLCAAWLAASSPGRNPLFSFLFFFALGCVLSYAGTLGLFLPVLFWASRRNRPLTARRTGLLGAALGGVAWLCVLWPSHRSSGVNSGPPTEPFWRCVGREALGFGPWLFIAAGTTTALLYWILATRGPRRTTDNLLNRSGD